MLESPRDTTSFVRYFYLFEVIYPKIYTVTCNTLQLCFKIIGFAFQTHLIKIFFFVKNVFAGLTFKDKQKEENKQLFWHWKHEAVRQILVIILLPF